jgi:hypothetical protein
MNGDLGTKLNNLLNFFLLRAPDCVWLGISCEFVCVDVIGWQ